MATAWPVLYFELYVDGSSDLMIYPGAWFLFRWKSILPVGFSQNLEQPGEMLVG